MTQNSYINLLKLRADCIKEFNDINKAIKFAKALSEKYPDATIDVNDSSDENSVWGVN